MPVGRHIERSIGQILFHLEKARRHYLEINTCPRVADLRSDLIITSLAYHELNEARFLASALEEEFRQLLNPNS